MMKDNCSSLTKGMAKAFQNNEQLNQRKVMPSYPTQKETNVTFNKSKQYIMKPVMKNLNLLNATLTSSYNLLLYL